MKSRQIFAGLSLLLVLSCTSSFAKYSGGTGEPNDPYRIATPEDLNSIGLDPCDWDKHFLMTADINMVGITGDSFNIIGDINTDTPFSGVFDGNGHSIERFTYLAKESSPASLFGFARGEHIIIKNLKLSDVNIAGDRWVGALIGIIHGNGYIIGCSVDDGKVSGTDLVGGLVGCSLANISDCYTNVEIRGSVAGGLIGCTTSSTERCFSVGSVRGGIEVGGLIGSNDRGGNVSNCYSLCSVEGDEFVGGLIGNTSQPVENCFSAGAVDGNDWVGAFIGRSGLDIWKCFWDDSINPGLNGTGDGSDPNVIGLPTAQIQMRNTFADAGWDMVDVWDIGENQTYPFLRMHLPGDISKDGQTNLYDLAVLAQNWLSEE